VHFHPQSIFYYPKNLPALTIDDPWDPRSTISTPRFDEIGAVIRLVWCYYELIRRKGLYHTLFWLDLYLSGSLEGIAPPAPFSPEELDPAEALLPRTYTRDELLTYQVGSRGRINDAGIDAKRLPLRYQRGAWTPDRNPTRSVCLYGIHADHGYQLDPG